MEVRLKFVTSAAGYLHFSFSTGLLSYALNSYVIESNEPLTVYTEIILSIKNRRINKLKFNNVSKGKYILPFIKT